MADRRFGSFGGGLLPTDIAIDKNAQQWGRLKTPEWEKWFGRRELEKMLARHSKKVSSRPISYWEDVAPDGLFLAWLAER